MDLQSEQSPAQSDAATSRMDLLLGLAIAAIAAAFCAIRVQILGGRFNDPATFGTYFSADTSRVFANMSLAGESHRAHVHPLFTAFSALPTALFRFIFRLSAENAVNVFLTLTCAAWTFGMWFVFRALKLPRELAAALTAIGIMSSSAIFWFPVAETHALASLSVLVALIPLLVPSTNKPRFIQLLLINLATFGVTITNWLAGIIVTLRCIKISAAAKIFAATLVISAGVFAAQKLIMWDHEIPGRFGREMSFLARLEPARLLQVAQIFFINVVVMAKPEVEISSFEGGPLREFVHLQTSGMGHQGVIEWVAIAAWSGLLLLGIHGLITQRSSFAGLILTVGGFLGFHWALYSVYGEETFLFIINCLPYLLVIAAFAYYSRFGRRLALPLSIVLLATMPLNNWRYFQTTVNIVSTPIAAVDRVAP